MRLVRADCAAAVPLPDGCCDRLVCGYVLDLLSADAMVRVVGESRRLLEPGGYLCLAALSSGDGWRRRAVAALWRLVHRVRPVAVGGCRPIDLAAQLPAVEWTISGHGTISVWGLASEWLVAEPKTESPGSGELQ